MLELKIYKDEYLKEVQEVRKVDGLKVPYRTADAVLDMLGEMDFEHVNEYKVINLVLKNKHHVTTIVRATYGLDEDELARVNIVEMYSTVKAIVAYVLEQLAAMGIDLTGGESNPNS